LRFGSRPFVQITELVHALLASDLVDAISIFTMPLVLGSGKKLFADGSVPHSFELNGVPRVHVALERDSESVATALVPLR
jgi:riboflavin biosynthesis pyrimidine reductase